MMPWKMPMSEFQYMLAANVARVRALKAILETVDSGSDSIGIPGAEWDAMHATLLGWERTLQLKLVKEMQS